MSEPTVRLFRYADELADAAAEQMKLCLRDALDRKGRASAALSGGSSPIPVYERLAQAPIAWKGVGLTLVDERWVPSGQAGSNADAIRACLAGRPAAGAFFVPLYNGHDRAGDGLKAAKQALAGLSQPFDLCVMGMGLDGHTASWFPNSRGLQAALDPDHEEPLVAIDASGCAGAGAFPERISLSFSAVAEAEQTILLLPDAEKHAVFRNALGHDPQLKPVNALQALGDRLTIFALDSTL